MNLIERLKQSASEIERQGIPYALAGGLVASLYRKEPRATADVDFVLLLNDEKKAESILHSLGLKAHSLRQANLEGGPLFAIKKKNTPVFILCGRNPDQPDSIGVDLILSNVPWIDPAIERAQANRVDFGFGGIPCLTPEDLILSKLYSIGNQSTRFMDLDDLRSIFESDLEIDWAYIRDRMQALKFKIPESLLPFVPSMARKGKST